MFPKLIFVLLLLAGVTIYWWRRRALPWPALLFIASVFLSRVYWKIAGTTVRCEQLTALLLFAWFFLDLLRRKTTWRWRWPAVLVLAFFPLMLLSSLLASPAPLQSLKKSLLYLPYFLAFLALDHYLFSWAKLREAWRAFYVFGAAAVSLSLAGFYLLFFGVNVGMVRSEYGSLWLRGTMVIPNIMGSTAVIVFLAALLRVTGERPVRRQGMALDMTVLAVSFTVAVMSYSRVAWIGMLGGALFIAFLRRRTLRLKQAVAVLLLLLGCGALLVLTNVRSARLEFDTRHIQYLGEYGEPRLDVDRTLPPDRQTKGIGYLRKVRGLIKNEPHDKWRFKVARAALDDWQHSPLIGRGSDSLQLMNPLDLYGGVYHFYISLTGVAILHDWGLIGLALYAAFVLLAFVQLARSCRSPGEGEWRETATALLAVLAVSTFMYQISTTLQLSIFWCLFAFYAAAMSQRPWRTAPAETASQ
jgi:hypothetical protein